MAKSNLCSEHTRYYRLIAPNLFEYLQLIEVINTAHIIPCISSTFLDKVNLIIHIELFIYGVTELIALLPAGVIMERD